MELTFGINVLDETDHRRAFNPKRIYKTHKQKESITGGHVNGHTKVFLLLDSYAITIPVGASLLYARSRFSFLEKK